MNDKDRDLQGEPKAVSLPSLDAGIPVAKARPSTNSSDKWLNRADRALEVCKKALDSNKESEKEFYAACQAALTTYRSELEKAAAVDEKKYWREQISSTLKEMYKKNSETKKFILGVMSIAVIGPIVIHLVRKGTAK